MKKMNIILCLLLLAFAVPNTVLAQKVGQSGFKFLDTGMGGRAAGMAEAYTVLGTGAEAVFYNPAGLVQMEKKIDVTFAYNQFIAGINYTAGAAAWNLGSLGVVGLSFVSPSYPGIEGTVVADNDQGYIETGKFDVGALAVGLSYAKRLTHKFTVGGTVKFASQDLGQSAHEAGGALSDNKASTLAFDFGTLFYPRFSWVETFAFGMSVRNFSQQVKYEMSEFELPLTFAVGFSVDAFDLFGEVKEDMALNLAVDALHPRDHHERVHLGAEFVYAQMFTVRGGYKFNYDEEGLTFGFGVKKGPIRIDYAFTDFGVFDNVNRFSVGMVF